MRGREGEWIPYPITIPLSNFRTKVTAQYDFFFLDISAKDGPTCIKEFRIKTFEILLNEFSPQLYKYFSHHMSPFVEYWHRQEN